MAESTETADWKALLCLRSTQTFDGTWVSPMDTPPSGIEDANNEVVAQIEFDAVASVVDVWIVKSTETHGAVSGSASEPHYDLVFLDLGGDACSGSDYEWDLTMFCEVSGRVVCQNPDVGTYDVEVEYGSHGDSTTFTIS